jgi:DNA polymerase I-like protein with 3'-5' exonuclease and polymerase domains
MNRLIQGSAADQGKQSMIDLWERGRVPLVVVHDEVGVSVESPEQAREDARTMETSVTLRVPSKVDVAIGNNWGEAL